MEIDDILEEDLLDIFDSFDSSKTINTIALKKESRSDELFDNDFLDQPIDQIVSQSLKNENGASKSFSMDSGNIDTLASLLKELLNNKTIEITIKIK